MLKNPDKFSHLFRYILYLFLFFNLCITLYGVFFIDLGFSYALFSFANFFLVYYFFFKSKSVLGMFLSFFLFLGFFFKFTITYNFLNVDFGEGIGNFEFSPKSLNELFYFSILGFLMIILSYKSLPNIKINLNFNLNLLKEFFKKNGFKFNLGFILFLILIAFFNLKYSFYIRGRLPEGPLLISYLLNALYSFALLILYSFIYEFRKNKSEVKYLIALLALTYFISLSTLSRIMPIYVLLIIFSYYYSDYGLKLKNLKVFLVFIIAIFFSIYSIKQTTSIRLKTVQIERCEPDCVQEKLDIGFYKNYAFSNITYRGYWSSFLTQRWVGIDSLMFVLGQKKSFNDFNKDLLTKHLVTVRGNSVSVKTPGIFAFFAQYNSYIYFAVLMYVMFFIFFLIESLLQNLLKEYRFSFSICCFFISWKIIHFGIGGINTVLYFLCLILTILLLFLLNKALSIKY